MSAKWRPDRRLPAGHKCEYGAAAVAVSTSEGQEGNSLFMVEGHEDQVETQSTHDPSSTHLRETGEEHKVHANHLLFALWASCFWAFMEAR